MLNESRNREDGIMYGAPWTWWEIQKHTNEVKKEINTTWFDEDGVMYIPKRWATYQEILWYTASVKKELATTLR